MAAIITLCTDFGLRDGYVAAMKGVMLGIAPDARLVDISHEIAPHDVRAAAFVLATCARFFPAGTVHLVVVDPGVGTARRPMAAQIGTQRYVGPDNGLVTMWLERAEADGTPVELVHLDRPQYWLPEVSHVFHGRDIFAPSAAHLANGVPLRQLGSPLSDPVRLQLPRPTRTHNGWMGEVIHIDHFGNVSTNLRRELLGDQPNLVLRLCGVEIRGMVRAFGERPPGELVALYGSTGNLIASVVNGSAAERLRARVGDPVEVII